MPPILKIEYKGFNELILRFTKWDAKLQSMLSNAMSTSMNDLETNSKNYPLETGANLPPPPYYIRGTGTQYQSFNRLESEQLDTKWARKMSISKREVRGEFYNTASYAPWVHGRTKQTGIHTSRLWRNVDKILKDNYPKILNNFKSAIRYALTIK